MRNTKQRDIVLSVVQNSCDHPTAEAIYERCREVMPNISLGTVYRNLRVLEEMGKVRLVRSDQDTLRYDKTVIPHAHVKCLRCGKVSDAMNVDCLKLMTEAREATGFDIVGIEVSLDGICPECKQRESEI